MTCENCGLDDAQLFSKPGHIVMVVCNHCGHYWPFIPPQPETKEPA